MPLDIEPEPKIQCAVCNRYLVLKDGKYVKEEPDRPGCYTEALDPGEIPMLRELGCIL